MHVIHLTFLILVISFFKHSSVKEYILYACTESLNPFITIKRSLLHVNYFLKFKIYIITTKSLKCYLDHVIWYDSGRRM